MKITTTKEISKLTAVLYSVSQDCFHLELIEDYIKNNIAVSIQMVSCSDYRLIGIVKNDMEGDEYIKEFRAIKKALEDDTNSNK